MESKGIVISEKMRKLKLNLVQDVEAAENPKKALIFIDEKLKMIINKIADTSILWKKRTRRKKNQYAILYLCMSSEHFGHFMLKVKRYF